MILLNLDGIKGDSQIEGHKTWIQISSVGFGVGRSIVASTGGADRETSTPNFSEITLGKLVDIASTNLFAQAAYGKAIGTVAKLDWIQTGGADKPDQLYMQLLLSNPIISNYSVSSGGDRPSESFSISFTKIIFKYTQFSEGGQTTPADPKGFDLKEGKPASS